MTRVFLFAMLATLAVICPALASEVGNAEDLKQMVLGSPFNLPSSLEARVSIVGTLPAETLSVGERRLVYGWQTPQGSNVQIDATLSSIGGYYKARGRLPQSSRDVIQSVLSRANLEISDLMPEALLEKFPQAFNPVTGQFYSDFANDTWSAGGIYFRPLTNEEIARKYPIGINGNKVDWAAEFKLFGEKPESVLHHDTMVSSSTRQQFVVVPAQAN